MKARIIASTAALGLLMLGGCGHKTPEADNVAAAADNAGDALDNQAAATRDAGDAAGGNAEKAADNQADALNNEADATRKAGENKADAMDKNTH